MRHEQLTADIPLGQIAAQKLEHSDLSLRQLLICGLGAADLRWPVQGSQSPGQDPRIRTGIQDGSGLGYRSRGTLVLAQGPEHGRLAEQRIRQLDGLAEGTRVGDAAFDQRQCLPGPAARRERYSQRQGSHADDLPGAVLPHEPGGRRQPAPAVHPGGRARRRSTIGRPATPRPPATARSQAPAPPIPRTTGRPRRAHPGSTGPCRAPSTPMAATATRGPRARPPGGHFPAGRRHLPTGSRPAAASGLPRPS